MKAISRRARRLFRTTPVGGSVHGQLVLDAEAGGAKLFRRLGGILLQEWRKHAAFPVHDCLRNWDGAQSISQREYHRVLKRAFFPKGHPSDDPTTGRTTAIGTLGETLLRWIRSNQKLERVLIEPPIPCPTASGDIDLLEIHEERPGRFHAIAWEVKATDNSAGTRNGKIYSQLDDYPDRLAFEAANIAERYQGPNVGLKLFLRNLGAHAFNKSPDVRYGAFVIFEAAAVPDTAFVPSLSSHPVGTLHGANNIAISIGIMQFKDRRQALWREMHLQP